MSRFKAWLAFWFLPEGVKLIARRLLSGSQQAECFTSPEAVESISLNEAEQEDRSGRRATLSIEEAGERAVLARTRELKDKHVGQRCFIIGSGSSINQQDLGRLCGESVITVSNSFVHPAMPLIRPAYHVLPPLMKSHGELYEPARFVAWLGEMDSRLAGTTMILHVSDRELVAENGLFIGRSTYYWDHFIWDEKQEIVDVDLELLPHIWSVSEVAISCALYMGFDRIYLLGFDHDWFNGVFVYFYDHSKDHAVGLDTSKVAFADSEFQMRRHAYIFKKYKQLYGLRRNIFNANANSKSYVDVFPRVRYESLFPG